jgi:lipoprotein-anchoring transpeptidase ErfK/SrfK
VRNQPCLATIFATFAALGIAGTAIGQNVAAPQEAAQGREAGSAIDGQILHAQVLLDRAGFSPGVIDGREGMSMAEAIKGFQSSRGLEATGELDQETRQALLRGGVPATRRLKIDPGDARGPFTGTIPSDPEQQAKLDRLGYRNLLEKIAEKFHTTPETIIALNSPATLIGPGAVLRLPNVLLASRSYGDIDGDTAQMLSDLNVSGGLPRAERIVVDKSDGVLRVFGKGDRLVAQFPATMGSQHDPLPLGNWKVTTVAYNPPFHYQPDLFWDVADSKEEQRLPPGPNGPVGTVWIDLTKEHYGIHGTAEPQTIQRAQSHGCVRLTNWDAARLATMVQDGMQVVFQA